MCFILNRYVNPEGHGFRCKMAIKVFVSDGQNGVMYLQLTSVHLHNTPPPLRVQSVQAVFRSLATLEKTVEKCHIELDADRNRLTFTLHCKHGRPDLHPAL